MRCSRVLSAFDSLTTGYVPSRKNWTLNLYSHGFLLREICGIKAFRHMDVALDHGVHLETSASKEEIRVPTQVFLTWSKWRHHTGFIEGKRVEWIQHPWVTWRRKNIVYKPDEADGAIYFPTHSVPGLPRPKIVEDSLWPWLDALATEFGKVTVSLHMHDIRVGLHVPFLKRGFKVVTFGSSLSPRFASRFYKAIRNFRIGISDIVGSQVFLLHELGLESYIIPRRDNLEKSDTGYFIASPGPDMDLVRKVEVAFAFPQSDESRASAAALTKLALGIGRPPHSTSVVYAEATSK